MIRFIAGLAVGSFVGAVGAAVTIRFGARRLRSVTDVDELLAQFGDEIDRSARIAEDHAERLKHTSHREGLGMGWLAGEELCREIADRIRGRHSVRNRD